MDRQATQTAAATLSVPRRPLVTPRGNAASFATIPTTAIVATTCTNTASPTAASTSSPVLVRQFLDSMETGSFKGR